MLDGSFFSFFLTQVTVAMGLTKSNDGPYKSLHFLQGPYLVLVQNENHCQ